MQKKSDSDDDPAIPAELKDGDDDLDALVAGVETVPPQVAIENVSEKPAQATLQHSRVQPPRPAPSPQPSGARRNAEQAVGAGSWFQPVAGGLLPVPAYLDGLPAALLAGARTAFVHAPAEGVVEHVLGGQVVARTTDGLRIRLSPSDSEFVQWHVRPGDRLAPGGVVGTWSERASALRSIQVSVVDADSRPVNAVELLTGLADPGELGLAAVGSPDEIDSLDPTDSFDTFDPFELDLELGVTVVPPA